MRYNQFNMKRIISITALILFSVSVFAQEQLPKIYVGAGSSNLIQVGFEKGWFDLSASYVSNVTVSSTTTEYNEETGQYEDIEEEFGPLSAILITPGITLAMPMSDRFKICIGIGTGLALYQVQEENEEKSGYLVMWDPLSIKMGPRYYITPKIAIYGEAGFHMFPPFAYAGGGLVFNL